MKHLGEPDLVPPPEGFPGEIAGASLKPGVDLWPEERDARRDSPAKSPGPH